VYIVSVLNFSYEAKENSLAGPKYKYPKMPHAADVNKPISC
jgi:hypothetical protein